jgi:hypothetical protein
MSEIEMDFDDASNSISSAEKDVSNIFYFPEGIFHRFLLLTIKTLSQFLHNFTDHCHLSHLS